MCHSRHREIQPLSTRFLGPSPDTQILIVCDWANRFGWDEIIAARRGLTQPPSNSACTTARLALVPYLGTAAHTVRALAAVRTDLVSALFFAPHSTERTLEFRYLQEPDRIAGLRWELLNPTAHCGASPREVRCPRYSPSIGILAAALQDPDWLREMDGQLHSCLWLPGIQARCPMTGAWNLVPYLAWSSHYKTAHLLCGAEDSSFCTFSVPSRLRSNTEI
jgi:hypothetical protein